MNLKLTISIDDVNPLKGYRILGDKTEKWLRQLNEDYGVKFSLFIPSNYHNKAPISQHKEWIQELNSISWVELAAHGHFHMTSDPQRFGECEMLELDTLQKCEDRFVVMIGEWFHCGIKPCGWRNPGWLCNANWNEYLNTVPTFEDDVKNWWFKYTAVHYEHNRGLNWNCKTFFGHDGIHQTDIRIHNTTDDAQRNQTGMIMFQSHIFGNHNDNVWNEKNYEQLRMSLDYLFENYNIEVKTLKECV